VIPPDTVADVPASVRENLVVGTSLRVDPPAPPPDGAAAEFGADAWLLSTRSGELALLVRDGDKPAGVMVGYVEEVEQGLLLIGLGDDLIGVAPDGISRASVALQNGGRLVLPVRDNVFGARLNDRWVGHVQWGGMQRP
jgi:hypothetical protein